MNDLPELIILPYVDDFIRQNNKKLSTDICKNSVTVKYNFDIIMRLYFDDDSVEICVNDKNKIPSCTDNVHSRMLYHSIIEYDDPEFLDNILIVLDSRIKMIG